MACHEGHTEIVDSLLKGGANPNLAMKVDRFVCLHMYVLSTEVTVHFFLTEFFYCSSGNNCCKGTYRHSSETTGRRSQHQPLQQGDEHMIWELEFPALIWSISMLCSFWKGTYSHYIGVATCLPTEQHKVVYIDILSTAGDTPVYGQASFLEWYVNLRFFHPSIYYVTNRKPYSF